MNAPTDVTGLRDTIIPKSDQLNADDLLAGPITVRIVGVKRGDTQEQPISIEIDGGHQPYRPCKSMRRVMIAAWGDDGRKWIGQSMTLYCDPDVKFGGVKVGGIRISSMTGISGRLAVMLTTTRSKRSEFVVEELKLRSIDYTALIAAIDKAQTLDELAAAFTTAQKEARANRDKDALTRIVAAKDARKTALTANEATQNTTTEGA